MFAPLIYFKDSEERHELDSGRLRRCANLYNGGVTAAAVQKNPSLVPTSAFVENMFPALANYYFPGSASANYFYGIYGVNAGSDLDNLHQLDRVTSSRLPELHRGDRLLHVLRARRAAPIRPGPTPVTRITTPCW